MMMGMMTMYTKSCTAFVWSTQKVSQVYSAGEQQRGISVPSVAEEAATTQASSYNKKRFVHNNSEILSLATIIRKVTSSSSATLSNLQAIYRDPQWEWKESRIRYRGVVEGKSLLLFSVSIEESLESQILYKEWKSSKWNTRTCTLSYINDEGYVRVSLERKTSILKFSFKNSSHFFFLYILPRDTDSCGVFSLEKWKRRNF